MKGYKHTEEAKEKMRKYRIGKPTTLGTKRPYQIGEKNVSNRPEVKKKISESKKGSLNPNWKGGISPKNIMIRVSPEMKFWKKECFKRDNFTCQKCNISGGSLQVHHINNFADFSELRFDIENGITLCKICHSSFHKIYTRRNNSREQLQEFLITK